MQVSYAIGVAEPVSLNVNCYGTNLTTHNDEQIAQIVRQLFDLRPGAIEERLKLREPIYEETAAYGHVGRTPQVVKKQFHNGNGEMFEREVELFPWEKLDETDRIKQAFGIC